MTIIRSLSCGIFVLALAAVPLRAQDTVTSSAGATEPEPETPPQSLSSLGPPGIQTSPDDQTFRAGEGLSGPNFVLGRHFQLSTSLNGGYDDNVNFTPTGSPSWFGNLAGIFGYQFGNPGFAIDFTLGGGISYYFDRPGGRDYDPNIHLRLFLNYQATARLAFEIAAFATYQSQPDVTTQLSPNRRQGNFFRTADKISARYSWSPRFSTISSYTFSTILFGNSNGSVGSQPLASDRFENAFNQEFRYLLLPTTTTTAGYHFQIADYQNTRSNQGTGNNPITQSLTAGVEQTFSPHLTAFLHTGVQFRSSQISPYVNASLFYSLDTGTLASEGGTYGFGATTPTATRGGTFVVWTNRYSIEESDLATGSGRQAFRTNLLFNYALTARISANMSVSYVHSTGGGVSSGLGQNINGTQNLFDVGPAIRYAITRNLAVNAGYRHTELTTTSGSGMDLAALGYTRNRYFAGVSYTF